MNARQMNARQMNTHQINEKTAMTEAVKKDSNDVLEQQTPNYICGVAVSLEIIGGKWKGVILWHLCHKTLRFSQLRRRLQGVTQKMLTQQLRELERDQLVNRKVYAEVPPRVEYSLTDLGRTLEPTLRQLCDWGKDFHDQHRQ